MRTLRLMMALVDVHFAVDLFGFSTDCECAGGVAEGDFVALSSTCGEVSQCARYGDGGIMLTLQIHVA